MHTCWNRPSGPRALLVVFLLVAAGAFSTAHAEAVIYEASLDGQSQSPPNASPGIGNGLVELDAVAHTMRMRVTFSGLMGTTTVCHIHAPTAVPGTGTVGVATPTFPGFPAGVTAGIYDHTFDMTLPTSYSASFLAANGGTAAGAEAALFQAIADGRAYLNIHTSEFPGGEIRGFFQPLSPTPTDETTWGRLKSLYD